MNQLGTGLPYLDDTLALMAGWSPGRWTHEYEAVIRRDPCSYCGRRAPVKARRAERFAELAARVGLRQARQITRAARRRASGRLTAMTRDHVIARCHDGPQHWSNLTAACRPCNERKGSLSMLEALLCAAAPNGT